MPFRFFFNLESPWRRRKRKGVEGGGRVGENGRRKGKKRKGKAFRQCTVEIGE